MQTTHVHVSKFGISFSKFGISKELELHQTINGLVCCVVTVRAREDEVSEEDVRAQSEGIAHDWRRS